MSSTDSTSETSETPAVPMAEGAFPARFEGKAAIIVLLVLAAVHLVLPVWWTLHLRTNAPYGFEYLLILIIWQAQPALLAMAAVFAPVRAIVRIPAALAASLVMPMLSIEFDFLNTLDYLIPSISQFFGYQVPYWIAYRMRGWRVSRRPLYLLRPATSSQFSLRAVFIVITVTCLLLGLGKWLSSEAVTRELPSTLGMILFMSITSVIMGAITSSFTMPVLGLGLAQTHRRWYLVMTLLVFGLTTTVLVTISSYAGGLDSTGSFIANIATVYLFILANLLVVRSCGYRLTTIRRASEQIAQVPCDHHDHQGSTVNGDSSAAPPSAADVVS